jgi:hypothetical protein
VRFFVFMTYSFVTLRVKQVEKRRGKDGSQLKQAYARMNKKEPVVF